MNNPAFFSLPPEEQNRYRIQTVNCGSRALCLQCPPGSTLSLLASQAGAFVCFGAVPEGPEPNVQEIVIETSPNEQLAFYAYQGKHYWKLLHGRYSRDVFQQFDRAFGVSA